MYVFLYEYSNLILSKSLFVSKYHFEIIKLNFKLVSHFSGNFEIIKATLMFHV